MTEPVFILDPEARFGRHFNQRRQMSVIAAAISKRWSVSVIAQAYGMHDRTVKTLRSGRRGKYGRAHQILAELGQQQFIELYLHEDDAARLDNVKRLRQNKT